MSNQEFVAIKDLKVGMKNINAVFIVLEISPATVTKEGREVRTLRVADASGAVNVSVWDAAGALLAPGDIVRLTRGYANLWRHALTLYSGKQGDLQKVSALDDLLLTDSVGEFCMLFNEQVNMSEPIPPSPPGPPPATPPAAPAAPATPPPAATTATTAANNNNKHKTYARPRHPHQRNNNRR